MIPLPLVSFCKNVLKKKFSFSLTPDAVVFKTAPNFAFLLFILLTRVLKPTVFIFAHKAHGGKFLPKRAVRYASMVETFVPEHAEFTIDSHYFFSGTHARRCWGELREAQVASKLMLDFGGFRKVIFVDTLMGILYRKRKEKRQNPQKLRRQYGRKLSQKMKRFRRTIYSGVIVRRGGVRRYVRRYVHLLQSICAAMEAWGVSHFINKKSRPSLLQEGLDIAEQPGKILILTTCNQPQLLSILSFCRELDGRLVSVLPHTDAAWLKARKFFWGIETAINLLEPITQRGALSEWDPNVLEKQVRHKLSHLDPGLVILMHDIHPAARAILKVVQQKQIRALFVQTLYISEDSRYNIHTLPQCENVSVMDDHNESLLTGFFRYDEQGVHIFGCPRYDLVPRKSISSERKPEKLILLVLQPAPPSTAEIFALINQFQDARNLLRQGGFRIIIRPHPATRKTIVRAIRHSLSKADRKVLIVDLKPKEIDWSEFGALVGFASNLHLEALLNDVPSVSIQPKEGFAVPLVRMGISVSAKLGDGDVVSKTLALATNSSAQIAWREKADTYLSRNPALASGDSAKRILNWAGFLAPDLGEFPFEH